MTQLALAFDPRHTAITFVETRPDVFRREFGEWLAENWHVYRAFEREADKLWSRGCRHYSARTIWHYLRHETAIREGLNAEGWKLNDCWTPSIGRLYMLLNPRRDGFFETRTSPTSGAVAE